VEVTISTERELKLEAPADFRLPDLRGLGVGLGVSPPVLLRETAVYYDTSDLRLTRWDCGLRHRASDAWTVKLAASGDGPALVRREFRFDDAPGRPPSAALDLLLGVTRGEALEPVARLRTIRRRVRLLDATGAWIAEVTDDRVAVLDGRRVARRFREVEVEFAGHCPLELVEGIVARLRRAGTGPAHRIAKHLRALGLESGVVPEVPIPEVGPDDAAAQVVRRTIARCVTALVRRDAGVRVDEDVEDVHRMRVATRRLRSYLRTFRPLLDEDWARGLQEDLRWLGRELGPVRDGDVLSERFHTAAAALPDAERRAAKDLLEHLAQLRQGDLRRLLEALRSGRYLELLGRLVEAARAPRVRPEAQQPARGVLAPLVQARWERLSRSVSQLGSEPDAEELHAVRIRAKHARYAAEAVTPVFGGSARRFARALRRVQQSLGQHQDAVVAIRWLREAAGHVSREAAVAAGMLAAREQRVGKRALERWPGCWRKAVALRALALPRAPS
jgi:CHAD domain-containing protein